ncbi:MAG: hypothetical protein QOE33_1884, partial [Acidobacteriota bacterium]|nr:hypothetical protein [Acidobacteriota bacterium]
MITFRNFTLGLLLSLSIATVAFAQTTVPSKRPAPTDQTVTVSISVKGVRFSALGEVGQMRVEAFDASGASVYNSDFQPGNVRDWALRDKNDAPLLDGSYLCVVTARGLSKRMSVRQGTITIEGGQASLQLGEGGQVADVEPEKSLTSVTAESAPATTLMAHNGRDGQVISTRGALTFRAGDFFGGKDQELMRLTPEGHLGIGTSDPQATLDVAGTLRARGGIVFDDGTVLKSAQGNGGLRSTAMPGGTLSTAAAGTGSQNRLAKWTDNAGNLGDSLLTEAGGGVGLLSSSGAGVVPLLINAGTVSNFAQFQFYPS